MNFLVDNQLPTALAAFFNAHGHTARHVFELGLDETPDLDIWSYARQRDWVMVSKDDDFVHLANRPGDLGRLVWVRTGNCRKPALLESFAKALTAVVAALRAGHRIIEVR